VKKKKNCGGETNKDAEVIGAQVRGTRARSKNLATEKAGKKKSGYGDDDAFESGLGLLCQS